MSIRLDSVIQRIRGIEREVDDLQRLKNKLPLERPYSGTLQVAFDKSINDLLNEKLGLEQLEIDAPSEELINEVLSVDMATASRIRVDREKPEAELTAKEEKVREFLRKIPKTEIHLHMEACISRDTLMGVLDHNKEQYDPEEVEKLYKFSNLQEFIKLFLFIIDSIKQPDDFELIFHNLRTYMEHNNVSYAEVFYAPSRLVQNGLDFNEVAQTLDKLSRDCRLEGGPDIRYLVDVSRTFGAENASKNLQRVLKAKCNSHIGIGLGGAELMGPARDFKDVFAQARAEGLFRVAHAGEDDGPWSVRDAVEILKAQRVGHGTSVIQDPSLMELMKEKQIPIEICLTSNIFTGKYVRQEKDHPVRRYYDDGLVCTVNTDDPEIFNVDLSEEFFKFYKHLNFTIPEIVDLVRQGVYSTFHGEPSKIWKGMEKEIQNLRQQYQL
ncbi:MAG: adenosine deaminase [Leptospiraceae bacterium]|nr:adenosine deaminase [Leptospiraceae bacterium]